MEKPPIARPEPEPPADAYEIMADKVGFVPNIRPEDNKFQAKFLGWTLLATVPLGAALFEAIGWGPWFVGALAGVLVGALGGLLISGLILAIRNLKR